MEVKFQLAKNNEQTVSINNIFLHSSYNPTKEAERFVENISLPFNAKYIVIVEPALSYCLPFLRKKFPDCKIGVVRFCKEFLDFNEDFDFYLDYLNNKENFENYLLQYFGETKLLQTYIINWKNSENIFAEVFSDFNKIFSSTLKQAKTLLITRQYFEKKWLVNSVNFFRYSKNCFVEQTSQIQKPIIILSSGPSCKKIIPTIKENRDNFFVICLSSAISACQFYELIPDLYMTTDGGYWAGQHLKKIRKEIPLVIPIEAFCPKNILRLNTILPFIYEDSLLASFIQKNDTTKLKYLKRNGTIAGTALEFAISKNDLPLFITGIDLSCKKGFQHTQPNEIEINNSCNDNRINTKQNRLIKSEFSNESLNIYKSWFENYKLCSKKVYRIIEKEDRKNSLGQIQDIDNDEFLQIIKSLPSPTSSKQTQVFTHKDYNFNTQDLLEFIEQQKNTTTWQNQLFPLDLVSLSYNPTNTELKNKISERSEKLFAKIRKILND